MRRRWSPGWIAGAVVLGCVSGFAGTAVHRAGGVGAGLVLAVGLVLACAVFLRAMSGGPAVLAHTVAVVVVVLALTYAGPAQDVLVTDDGMSLAWLVLSPFTGLAALLLPRSWFSEAPSPGRPRARRIRAPRGR